MVKADHGLKLGCNRKTHLAWGECTCGHWSIEVPNRDAAPTKAALRTITSNYALHLTRVGASVAAPVGAT